MPYTNTTWVSAVTPLDAPEMNNLESQYTEATNSFNQDAFTAFVLYGGACSKDGTIASQLDVTVGVYYALQSDSTTRRRAISATTYSTTGHPSTTMYLDANPDGTFSWGTAHSGQANYLPLCQVTTDASANINVVTDRRNFNTSWLSAAVGTITFPGQAIFNGRIQVAVNAASSNQAALSWTNTAASGHTWNWYVTTANSTTLYDSTSAVTALSVTSTGTLTVAGTITTSGGALVSGAGSLTIESRQSGSANGIIFETWSGTANVVPLSIGGQFASALSYFDNSGNFYLDGSLISASGGMTIESQQSGAVNGIAFETWSGTANVVPFSVGGQFASALLYVDNSGNLNGGTATGLPTTRNGTATSVPIYTGTTTPTSPPTGAIWVKA